ncbi:MAG: C40 family peptidase [Bacteroidales bacterium]|jgi:hypothetical protein|nr:C40 family peptidase [Bacteroidales bacterium]MCI1786388.1 C40 family peptidase [Bacteroidales bacterium]
MLKKISIITFCFLLASAVAYPQARRYAVVEFSVNFIRENPAYEAELGDQALMGTVVEVTGEHSYWRSIITPEPYKGWVNEMGLVEMPENKITSYIAAPKYICTAEYSHVYSKPDLGSERLSDLVMGDILRIRYAKKTVSSARVVRKRKFNGQGLFYGVLLPSGRAGFVPADDLEEFRGWAERKIKDCSFRTIYLTARLFLGVPYMWGGTSIKCADCSGFVRSVWFMNGLLLPRNASQQARTGDAIDFHPDYSVSEKSPAFRKEMLKRISYLEPGDLLFFGKKGTLDTKEKVTHVAIYLGNGKYIHSSEVVRISSLIPGDKDFSRVFIKARRVLNQEDKGKGIVSILKSPVYFKQ